MLFQYFWGKVHSVFPKRCYIVFTDKMLAPAYKNIHKTLLLFARDMECRPLLAAGSRLLGATRLLVHLHRILWANCWATWAVRCQRLVPRVLGREHRHSVSKSKIRVCVSTRGTRSIGDLQFTSVSSKEISLLNHLRRPAQTLMPL